MFNTRAIVDVCRIIQHLIRGNDAKVHRYIADLQFIVHNEDLSKMSAHTRYAIEHTFAMIDAYLKGERIPSIAHAHA